MAPVVCKTENIQSSVLYNQLDCLCKNMFANSKYAVQHSPYIRQSYLYLCLSVILALHTQNMPQDLKAKDINTPLRTYLVLRIKAQSKLKFWNKMLVFLLFLQEKHMQLRYGTIPQHIFCEEMIYLKFHFQSFGLHDTMTVSDYLC